MIFILFIIILVIFNIYEKHTFTGFLQYCKKYISQLQFTISKIKNLSNDFFCHQIKFKKVRNELVKEVKKKETEKEKTGWFK